MIKFSLTLILLAFISVSTYAYHNSERTFQAKFKNIDGLPKGASVTALGVKVGEVIRTKPTSDGIIVTVRITNKLFPKPQGGSQLTITSFRPNQGRVLEIIPPEEVLSEAKSWLIQEPITTESWLHASLDLLEGLKTFSGVIIKYVTPENFEKARLAFSQSAETLNQTAVKLLEYESSLITVKEKLSTKVDEANKLLVKLQQPIKSLGQIINDKKLTTAFKKELDDFSDDLNSISKSISAADFTLDAKNFKTMLLDHLNHINETLTALDQMVMDPDLKQKIKNFNRNISDLNTFYGSLTKEDIENFKIAAKKARETTTSLEEKTSPSKNIKQN